MSKHDVLNGDGTLEQDSSIKIMDDPHRMSTFIVTECRYEVHGDRIKFTVVKGRRHGEDKMISAGNYDRRMAQDIVREISENFRFTLGIENGRRALFLLPSQSPEDDMIYFPVSRSR